VPTGQSLQTQSLQVTLSQVVDGSDTRVLQEPLEIAITKTPVYSVYPLTYLKSFNAKPYVLVVLTTNCKDGAYQDDATCGWFNDAAGMHVLDSQGFCCPCDAQSTWQQSVLGGATDRSRGQVNCNLFSSNLFLNGLPASASCLRMSDKWYAAYTLGDASYEFTLAVTITKAASNTTAGGGSSSLREVLSLSPVSVVAINAGSTVAAELLGDLGGFVETPVLSSKLLFIPRPANNSTLSDDVDTWPLLDRSAVSLDGSGCDKPGVMFSGFRNQPNRCGVPAGSCLSNQLQDIADADAVAMAAGNMPRSNVAALQAGAPSLRDAQPGAMSPEKKRLALPTTQLRNSIVTLSLNADSIRFVINYSPGRIISAELIDFLGRTVGGFVALSGNGRLSATMVNNGTIDASYYLSVLNCSAGVALIPSPGALAVPSGGVRTQQWACSVEDDAAADRNCTVVLQDARFVTIDTRLVRFYTNATVYDAIPQLDGRALGTGVGALPGGAPSCAQMCPNLLNLMCHAMHFCWMRLALGLLLCAVLAAFAWWTLVSCGPCRLASSASRYCGSRFPGNETAPAQRSAAVRDVNIEMHAPPPRLNAKAPWRDDIEQCSLEAAALNALLLSQKAKPGSGRTGNGTRASALLAEYTRAARQGGEHRGAPGEREPPVRSSASPAPRGRSPRDRRRR